tara:strand:- start:525 stop:857 length:333 start_codon:yes stop_codon:yes gene_type:complete
MLKTNEKARLYELITAMIGEDASIKAYKSGFNQSTVIVVEEMIDASLTCNANMKKLISDLLGVSGTLARGWLSKALATANRNVSITELKGYGCLVSVKSRWKTAIINSTI